MVERLKSADAVSARLYWLCQKELSPMSGADPNSITLKDPGRTSHLLLFEYQTVTFRSCWKQRIDSETVGKVPEQILGRDAENNDLTECATINEYG